MLIMDEKVVIKQEPPFYLEYTAESHTINNYQQYVAVENHPLKSEATYNMKKEPVNTDGQKGIIYQQTRVNVSNIKQDAEKYIKPHFLLTRDMITKPSDSMTRHSMDRTACDSLLHTDGDSTKLSEKIQEASDSAVQTIRVVNVKTEPTSNHTATGQRTSKHRTTRNSNKTTHSSTSERVMSQRKNINNGEARKKFKKYDGNNKSNTGTDNKTKLIKVSEKSYRSPSCSITSARVTRQVSSNSNDLDKRGKGKQGGKPIKSNDNATPNEAMTSSIAEGKGGRKKYKCNVCGKLCNQRSHLTSHMRTHTGEKPYKCRYCDKTFATSSPRNQHEMKHTGKHRHSCTICGKGFRELKKWRNHQLSHSGERPYTCDTCGKAFVSSDGLHAHKVRHTGVRPYTCAECDQKFYINAELEKHLRTHSGERPFSCDVCKESFRLKSTLRRHMYKHTTVKPHACAHCSHGFVSKGELVVHIRRHHTGEKPIKCRHCDRRFAAYNDRIHHERRQHGAEGK